jgi:hypothetical protein
MLHSVKFASGCDYIAAVSTARARLHESRKVTSNESHKRSGIDSRQWPVVSIANKTATKGRTVSNSFYFCAETCAMLTIWYISYTAFSQFSVHILML